jgi:hypothetical protein
MKPRSLMVNAAFGTANSRCLLQLAPKLRLRTMPVLRFSTLRLAFTICALAHDLFDIAVVSHWLAATL